jgi:hypothetical protein
MPMHKAASLLEYCSDLPDPRAEYNQRHQLLDILVIALCAVIAGAESWTDMELFGKAKEPWLRKFLA